MSSIAIDTIVLEIKERGYSVVENVIPDAALPEIRREVTAAQQRRDAKTTAELEQIRARGHRVGAAGVGLLKQVINETQCFAPYVADPRLVGVAEAFFGDFVRVSCTDCVITHPGSDRGPWHADWPYNPTNTAHIKAPYPDVLMHLSTIWMLTEFTADNGGTYVLPGSHMRSRNPVDSHVAGIDPDGEIDGQMQATGPAGSVFFYDSRMWHAVAPNCSDDIRIALIIRYAPWWLNLTPSMRGTPDNERMVAEIGGKSYDAIPICREAFEQLPDEVKPLYRHWVLD